MIMNYMGGGFGAKNGAPHSTYVAAALAKHHRPPRALHSRSRGRADRRRQPHRDDAARHARRQARRHAHRHPARRVRSRSAPAAGWPARPGSITRCTSARTSARRSVRVRAHVADGELPRAGHTSKARSASSARWTCSRASSSIDPLELRRRNYAERRSGQESRSTRTSISTSATPRAPKRFGWDAAARR